MLPLKTLPSKPPPIARSTPTCIAIAARQRPELAEDAAQEALLLIYENIGTCRDPRAFLKFAIYQLMTAFHRLAPRRSELSLDEPIQTSDEAQPLVEILPDSRRMEAEVAAQAHATDFLRWLRSVIVANPRAVTNCWPWR